jgi:hypothetical protein
MKIKIITLLLLLGTTLFAQINAIVKLESIKKITVNKKELLGTWLLDTSNSTMSNKTRKGTTVTKIKSLHYEHKITQWTFLKNRHVLSAPDKDTIYYSLNAAKDLIYLWADKKENKAQLMAMFQIQVASAEKLLLVFKEDGDVVTLYLNRKTK